jgi:hypothetical protein
MVGGAFAYSSSSTRTNVKSYLSRGLYIIEQSRYCRIFKMIVVGFIKKFSYFKIFIIVIFEKIILK